MTASGNRAIAIAAACGLAAGALHALAAPAPAPVPVPARRSVLRVALNADIRSTDPGVLRDENTDAVLLHVVEGLVAPRHDGTIAPMLARSWTVSNGGRTYTFLLRRRVMFQNGAPLTSADVIWSLRRYLSPATHWSCLAEFSDHGIGRIVSLAAPGPYTVKVTLDRPAPLFLATLARPDCGQSGILQRASVGPDGEWRAPIGTGPFELAAWKRNQYIDLVRFPGYRSLPGPPDGDAGGKRALVDEIHFEVIPDDSAAVAALLRGDLDILDGIDAAELPLIRREPSLRLEMSPTFDFYAVLFQTQDALLRDPRMREAIALTIDTAALTRAVTWGTGAADNSPVPAHSPYHGPIEAALRAPDLARARQLLEACGYRGQTITLMANHRYPMMFDSAVLVQAMAAQAGIHMRIDTMDWASQLSRYFNGSYQAMVFAFSARLDPSLNFALLIGSKRRDPRKVWDSREARDLLAQSADTADRAERQQDFDRLTQAFLRDTPAIVLFNSTRIAAVRGGVTGFTEWPAGEPRYWNVGLR
jgi:peptide/nickel transport system substrate-binding protein